jgi:hypothetical protein
MTAARETLHALKIKKVNILRTQLRYYFYDTLMDVRDCLFTELVLVVSAELSPPSLSAEWDK